MLQEDFQNFFKFFSFLDLEVKISGETSDFIPALVDKRWYFRSRRDEGISFAEWILWDRWRNEPSNPTILTLPSKRTVDVNYLDFVNNSDCQKLLAERIISRTSSDGLCGG
jgi:hypothetical protein